MTAHGRFSLEYLESVCGDFRFVLMKPFESRVLRARNGERPLTTVGYAWACGCEARGRAFYRCDTCYWTPCARHARTAARCPLMQIPADLAGDFRVPIEFEGLQRGWEIFEKLPASA